ncbi:MAG: hypothetical protein Q8O00_08465 [Holophaga sp.]|nr:hypothetical protein [Holophaga sp.]
MSLFALDDSTCQQLAESHPTPLFAYDQETASAGFQALRTVLPQRVRIAYAMKANPFPPLLETFAALNASFDCASGGELRHAANLDLPQGRMFYAGPGKRDEELALALALGARIQAESWEDLVRIERLSSQPVAVNLRVHPASGADEGNRIIGGTGPSAFGVDEEDAPAVLTRAQQLTKVQIRGLHVFAASNQRSAQALLQTHAMVLNLAQELQKLSTFKWEQIDLGGGLGVPYSPDELPLDSVELGRGLAELLEANPWFQGELILEPGRFLAASCGIYLARVVRVKESRGKRFVILEGGINHLLRPLLTSQAFPVKAVGKVGATRPATLAGPLCTSLDRLGEVLLPELEPGDLLAFGMTGAYGFSEAMTNFLSHPVPEEIWVEV